MFNRRDPSEQPAPDWNETDYGDLADLDACLHHPFEPPERICGRCGHPYCRVCLVIPDGADAMCKACAMAAAGVRSNAAIPPAMPRREVRKLVKRFNQQREAEQRLPVAPGPHPTW